MNMEVSISEQNLVHIMRKVESELEDMRECVRQSNYEADSGHVVSADEVFSELRQRNAAVVKRNG